MRATPKWNSRSVNCNTEVIQLITIHYTNLKRKIQQLIEKIKKTPLLQPLKLNEKM